LPNKQIGQGQAWWLCTLFF